MSWIFSRYLASNSFKQVVGGTLNVDKSTGCRVFHACADALITRHLKSFIVFPKDNALVDVKRKFYDLQSFPNIIGAIDCTHVKMKPPIDKDNIYRNRKGYKSLNVQAVLFDVLIHSCECHVARKCPRFTDISRIRIIRVMIQLNEFIHKHNI